MYKIAKERLMKLLKMENDSLKILGLMHWKTKTYSC